MIANNEEEYNELKTRFLEQKNQFSDLLVDDANKGNECAKRLVAAIVGWELLDKMSNELSEGKMVKLTAFDAMNMLYMKWLICLESRGYPFPDSMKEKLILAKELIAEMEEKKKTIDKTNLN